MTTVLIIAVCGWCLAAIEWIRANAEEDRADMAESAHDDAENATVYWHERYQRLAEWHRLIAGGPLDDQVEREMAS